MNPTRNQMPARQLEMISTRCTICGTPGNATELYPANFQADALNAEVFSARRLPDRIHYRMVKCDVCGLVRSDPVADPTLLRALYQQSTFSYHEEVPDLQRTYGRYLTKLSRWGVKKNALLEIGCGNGFFLEQALAQGYQNVQGVEPSADAVAQAVPSVRSHIKCGLMHPGLFEPASFDVICLFQVFDHLPDPAALLDECFRVVRPGGFVLCLNHNIKAVSARLLGERSPIIDIEHTYLYGPATMSRIFTNHGFHVQRVGPVFNDYALRYLVRLVPLPPGLKQAMLSWLQASVLGRIRLTVPLGNLYLVAQKPLL